VIKLFVSDIDGTLTDGTVFVGEDGEKFKQFSHRDGRGFHLLREKGCSVCIITSEIGGINAARVKKLQKLGTVQYFFDGSDKRSKMEKLCTLCDELKIDFKEEIAFIGDDTNDLLAIEKVRHSACPRDAHNDVVAKATYRLERRGGQGAVREYIDFLIGVGLV